MKSLVLVLIISLFSTFSFAQDSGVTVTNGTYNSYQNEDGSRKAQYYSGVVRGPVTLTNEEKAKCKDRNSIQARLMCERGLLVAKRVEIAKKNAPKTKVQVVTDEELDKIQELNKIAKDSWEKEKEELKSISCPESLSDAQCNGYRRNYSRCLDMNNAQNSSDRCGELANYQTVTHHHLQKMCPSSDLFSCPFFVADLNKCFKETKNFKSCKVQAAKKTRALDEVKSIEGIDKQKAENNYRNCIKENPSKIETCKEESIADSKKEDQSDQNAVTNSKTNQGSKCSINPENNVEYCDGGVWIRKGNTSEDDMVNAVSLVVDNINRINTDGLAPNKGPMMGQSYAPSDSQAGSSSASGSR